MSMEITNGTEKKEFGYFRSVGGREGIAVEMEFCVRNVVYGRVRLASIIHTYFILHVCIYTHLSFLAASDL